MQTDVVVVGAGPAGSVAAHQLAAAGVKVALLDKAVFPRDKSCGDGVTLRGLALLNRIGLGDWVSQFPTMDTLRMTSPDGQVLDVALEPGEDLCAGRTIPRRVLDARLVELAAAAGAHVKDGVRVTDVRMDNGWVRVAAGDLAVQARLLILADGSHAPVTRRLGLASGMAELVATRQYLAGDPGPVNRLEIHFQPAVLPGYSWLFPMGEGCVNVGAGTYTWRTQSKDVSLHQVMEQFIQQVPSQADRLKNSEPQGPLKSHPLRTQYGATQTHADHVLVVGDAAGLVNPFSGEGIAPAMESAEMAACCARSALESGDVSADGLSGYTQALDEAYKADRRAARLYRFVLDRPRLMNHVFRRLHRDPRLARLIAEIIIDMQSPRMALRPGVLARLVL